jgi:hypothetical protein
VAVGIAVIAVGAAFSFTYYFGDYRQSHPNEGITALAWYLRSAQDTRAVYFVGLDEPPDYTTIRFLAPDARVLRWDLSSPTPPPASNGLLSILMPLDGPNAEAAQRLVSSHFPTGATSYLTNAAGRPIFQLVEISAAGR